MIMLCRFIDDKDPNYNTHTGAIYIHEVSTILLLLC